MNGWNDTVCRRRMLILPALIVFLAGVLSGTAPSATGTERDTRAAVVGDATIGVTWESARSMWPAYGILDGLVFVTDGSASLTPDLESLTVVAPSAAAADAGAAELPWAEAAPLLARVLASHHDLHSVLPGGEMDVIAFGHHALFVPPALITSARLASAGSLDTWAKRRSVRRKLYAAAALRAVTLQEAQRFDEMLSDDLAALQSGAVTMLGATDYVASGGLDLYTQLRIISGTQAAAAHGASTADVAAKVTQRVSATSLGKSVQALGVLAFAVNLAEEISESRARQRLLAAAAADALSIASLEDARRLLEGVNADPAMTEGLADAIGQLTAVSQTRLEEYAETAGEALAGSLPSLAGAVVAYLGTGGAALVVREAAELGKELIGYSKEVLTVSAMATLGIALGSPIEALVAGEEVGGSGADAYAMRELVTLHDRLGAEATASIYNLLWTDRWRNSSSLAGIARGAGLTLAEWLTADAGTEEAYRDEAAWRVRRVRDGAAFAAALPQLLGELEARYVGPPSAVVEAAVDDDGSGIAAGRVLFSEDFESYAVGSLPEDYIIVHNGLGTTEQRIEAEGGNRHLRTAAQTSWSLHMREDFAFDLPDVLRVSWRMRVDKDLDRYGYTTQDGTRYAQLGSFSIKNADERDAGISIYKYESHKGIMASCPRDKARKHEVQLGVWADFRLDIDFGSGRHQGYVNGEMLCDAPTGFIDLSGRWNSWGEAPGIRFGSGNSGLTVTRFDDIVIRTVGEGERGKTASVPEAAAADSVDCAGWDSNALERLRDFYGDITPEDVLACLRAGVDPNAELPLERFRPLHMAAAFSSNPAVITSLVDAGADLNAASEFGMMPLHAAAIWNTNPGVVEALVAAGADPNAGDPIQSLTALHSAAKFNQNPAIIQTMLDAGADPNARGKDDITPLHRAAAHNPNPEVIDTLIRGGADPTARDAAGRTPLEVAKEQESPAKIIAALEEGARSIEQAHGATAPEAAAADSVDCEGWDSNAPERLRDFYGDITPEDVTACLRAGADPDARLVHAATPLHFAATFSTNPAVIRALLDAGADVNAQSDDGTTPLHIAATFNDNPAIIAALLDGGADPNARRANRATPLHLAALGQKNPAVIAALLDAGADINAQDEDGNTPLDLAKLRRRPAKIIAALEERARSVEQAHGATAPEAAAADSVDCEGWDPNEEERLQSFYKDITPEKVAACLKAGADPHARLVDAATPLHFAAMFNTDPAVIGALLDAGADVNAQSNNGTTPLHGAAAFNDNPAIISVLLEAGAEPDAKAAELADYTPLHFAAQRSKNPAIIAALLDGGADPNARGTNRATPLHLAALGQENPAAIAALLDAGADPRAQENQGRTPLDIAKQRRRSADIIAALEGAVRAAPSAVAVSPPEPGSTTGRIVGGITDWLDRQFGSGGLRLELAAPIRAEEDGDDTVTVHLPGAQLVERDGGDGFAFGDLALEVTAEDDTAYEFETALPSAVEVFTAGGRADSRITIDDSEIVGVWRSDLDGATALDATVSDLRVVNDEGRQQLGIDSIEISSEMEQGSDALWDGGFTVNLSDLSHMPGLSNEGLRLEGFDISISVEDANLLPLSSLPGMGAQDGGESELDALQEGLALFARGGFGRLEINLALRDLVSMDSGEVIFGLGELDWLVVLDDRKELSDLAIRIEAAEPELHEAITGVLPSGLIPDAATVDIALTRFPLRQIAEELQELAGSASGSRAVESALERVVATATAEAGTAIEIRDIRIVGRSIEIEAEGLFRVDTESALGASGQMDARIRGFGDVMAWAAEQGETDLVDALVYLKGLGELLDHEDDDSAAYAYALKASRDGSITVNDVPLQRLLEKLQ